MKIFQTLKIGVFFIMLGLGVVSMLTIALIIGESAVITPSLILLILEIAALTYGVIFGDIHLSYTAPSAYGYKYFRSMPDFESKFRKQCIFADVIVYSIGFAATILNFTFMADKELIAMIGISYLFIVALSRFLASFVSVESRIYAYPKMLSMVPVICGIIVFFVSEDIPADLLPINTQIIILAVVTVFIVTAEFLFYKRLSNNLKTTYVKG